MKMTFSMKGKERDLELATQLREAFMAQYAGNESAFKDLINALGDQTLDRLIHRLKVEKNINLYRDYNALKEVALDVKMTQAKDVFQVMSQVDEARVWINDNSKYTEMVFEALYDVFKESEKLKPFIEEAVEEERA